MAEKVEAEIRAFIAENFLFQDNADSVAGDESLLESGIFDSTAVLEMVRFLEEGFGLRIADSEVVPANFDSIDALVSFVNRKTVAGAEPAGAVAAN